MRAAGLLLVVAAALGGTARAARAQTPAEVLLARGIQAARDLDYDSAATLLRLALASPSAARLGEADRSRALAHIGATDVFRGRRDSAGATFRQLLAFNPRYRLDQLVFPPEVTEVFEATRRGSRAALVVVPPRSEIVDRSDQVAARIYPASPHRLTVVVVRESGMLLRTLYAGESGDSLGVGWDGRDSSGVLVAPGRYLLRVTSRGADDRAARTVIVPLDVRAATRDTLPAPPPFDRSQLKPETAAGTGNARPLLWGALTAAAALVLPAVVDASGDAGGSRYVVAGAAGTAGIVGVIMARRPHPIAENVAANQALRRVWQLQAEQVRAENAVRRRDVRLIITAGTTQTLGQP